MHISENMDKKSDILIHEDFNKKSLTIMFMLFLASTLLLTTSQNVLTSLIELTSIILVITSCLIYLKNKYELKKIERSIYRNYTQVQRNTIETLDIDQEETLYMDDEI